MACPLSLGDILAVVQLCYKIGKQLTVARLEAVQEFQNVKTMLFSLASALEQLDSKAKKPGSVFARAGTAQTAAILVSDCYIRLQSLAKIVDKYSGAMSDSERGWGESFVQGLYDNCLRVMWSTKEVKELTTLYNELNLRMTTINTLILATNSSALGDLHDQSARICNGVETLDGKTDLIIKMLQRLDNLASVSSHRCSNTENPTIQSLSPVRKPTPVVPPEVHFLSWKTKHPGGLPHVSEQRCKKIDSIYFEFEISEETETGRQVICPFAQLKGYHFISTQQGKIREDLFQCNCKAGLTLRSAGIHTSKLKEFSCGPRTFLARSHYQISTPLRGRCWWLLQTQTRAGGQKNLFLKLHEIEKRHQFTETVASMLRTNVARNILSGTILPFDLARRAKKVSKDDDEGDRIQIAWTYDERKVGKSGTKVSIDKLPGKERIEFSNPAGDSKKQRFVYDEKVQDHFTKENAPNFSWYRVAMFESLNICSSIEDDDPEDAHFFLDHFHTSIEFKVELSHPTKDPGDVYWGVGEFGGANVGMNKQGSQTAGVKDLMSKELKFNISRFTITKDEGWNSPRPVNCSICFTFPPWSSELRETMGGIWEKYESLSTTTGRSATEFALARLDTETKENPQVLMRVKNAMFEEILIKRGQDQELLERHDFNTDQTFRDCWLLLKKNENSKSPIRLTLRSMTRDIHCNINLSAEDALGLSKPGKSIRETNTIQLHQPPSHDIEKSQTSWCWIYPRELYGIGTPSAVDICGSLKLEFASGSDLEDFSKGMQRLLNALRLASEYETLPPYIQQEKHSPITHEDALRRSKTLPSKSEPPHAIRERMSSWSVGLTPPSPELKATGLWLHSGSSVINRHSSMYIVTQGKAWEPPQPHYTASEYHPHSEKPNHDRQRQDSPGAFIMPDAGHFIGHISNTQTSSPVIDNDSYNYGWNKETHYQNYTHDAHLQRDCTEPTKNNLKHISPNQSPLTSFPDSTQDDHLMQNTPRYTHGSVSYSPQMDKWQEGPYHNNNNNNDNGSKRCIVISDYVGSSHSNQLSLRAGQIYNVVPQPDSYWVWIDGNSCGPSGFAPRSNFQEYV